MSLLAIVFPWFYFFVSGRATYGLICLLLQLTVIGWLPAAFWAFKFAREDRRQKRNEQLFRATLNAPSIDMN